MAQHEAQIKHVPSLASTSDQREIRQTGSPKAEIDQRFQNFEFGRTSRGEVGRTSGKDT
jgi:hypothetical protein